MQASDARGGVAFTSVWPGAYSGRWPHIHFEVYPSLAEATAGGSKLVTSQIALPEDACGAVYATGGYEASAQNLARTSLPPTWSSPTATPPSSAGRAARPSAGMTLALNVGV